MNKKITYASVIKSNEIGFEVTFIFWMMLFLSSCSPKTSGPKIEYDFKIVGEYKPEDIEVVTKKLKDENCKYEIDSITTDYYDGHLEYFIIFKEVREDDNIYSYGRSLWIKDKKITTDNGYSKALRIVYVDGIKVIVPEMHILFNSTEKTLKLYATKALEQTKFESPTDVSFGNSFKGHLDIIVKSGDKSETLKFEMAHDK